MKSPIVILGVDPGVTTGYALVRAWRDGHFERIHSGEIHDYKSVQLLARLDFDFLALEDFILRDTRIHDRRLRAVRAIGALEVLVPEEKLFLQEPYRKEGAPNSLLVKLGLLEHKDSEHVRDAIRHCFILARSLLNESKSSPSKRAAYSHQASGRGG